MGAIYIEGVAYKDTWCLLVYKGGPVLLEALTTVLPGADLNLNDASPLNLQVIVTRRPGEKMY